MDMITKKLIKLSDYLDSIGLHSESNGLDKLIVIASGIDYENEKPPDEAVIESLNTPEIEALLDLSDEKSGEFGEEKPEDRGYEALIEAEEPEEEFLDYIFKRFWDKYLYKFLAQANSESSIRSTVNLIKRKKDSQIVSLINDFGNYGDAQIIIPQHYPERKVSEAKHFKWAATAVERLFDNIIKTLTMLSRFDLDSKKDEVIEKEIDDFISSKFYTLFDPHK